MSSGTNPKKGLGGLVNMGLTCYANSVLQCMRHCQKIPWIMEEGRYGTLFDPNPPPKRQLQQNLTRAFAEVVQLLEKCEKGQSVRPGDFWTKLHSAVEDTCFEQFATKAPHDSHEFFLFLLDAIHEALSQKVDMTILRPPPTTEKEGRVIQALEVWKREFTNTYSPFVHLFYGLTHVRIICQSCKNVSHRWETFTTLKACVPPGGLGLEPPTLKAMLEEEFKPEAIDGYHCEKCPQRTTAHRVVTLWRLPQTLVVTLKRFTPDGRKIHTRMATLPPGPTSFDTFFSDESPERAGSLDYSLRAIVDHHGGAGGGHYTAQCKSLRDDSWIIYDDEGVGPIPAPHFGDSTYMLFFERIPAGTHAKEA